MNQVSHTASISKLADIEVSSKGSRLVVGENVMIDAFVKIKFTGGIGDIVIGDGSYINSGCVLYSGNGITIGKDVLIAANCTIAPVNHAYIEKNRTIKEQRFKPTKGGIIIEDDTWIGAGVIILDGSVIKKGSVIGAGSIVNGITEEYGVYSGNPLQLIKKRE
ncbi:MAG: acyltransferase [Chitinophagaceae bacterium]|nr:acyltransferase [Chitinophagaceae bacterium]